MVYNRTHLNLWEPSLRRRLPSGGLSPNGVPERVRSKTGTDRFQYITGAMKMKEMNKLSPRQMEYLLLFATWRGYDYGVSEAAVRFGVTKATVSRMVDILCENGYLKRDRGLMLTTESGRVLVEPLIHPLRRLTAWLESGVGLTPHLAEQEARRMVTALEPETVSAMLKTVESNEEKQVPERKPIRLADGEYAVGFQVLKKGTTESSMGDGGFEHPARRRCAGADSTFLLRPRRVAKLSRSATGRRMVKGILDQLWYWDAETWKESQRQDGGFVLPQETLDETGKLRVRLRASVGMLFMPESEADIVFHLEDLHRNKEEK